MIDEKLLIELQEYLNCHLMIDKVEEYQVFEDKCYSIQNEIDDFINNTRKPTFHQVLFNLIDKSGLSDTDVYKKAHIDRRLFSKIRSNPNYKPSKNTVISFAIALGLDEDGTVSLLESAGYSLSDSDNFDLIIRFFLGKKIYDLQTVNEILDYYKLKLLGGA
ncbi:MAG: hypothetical protein K0S51_2169 [Bacillales bacterium]|jgi:hypothetical protein|nr:hypothetical protein [Bacillales bacterium]